MKDLTAGQAGHLRTKVERRARAAVEAIERLGDLQTEVWLPNTRAAADAKFQLATARAEVLDFRDASRAAIEARTRGRS